MSFSVYKNKNECCGCSACFNICPKKAINMCKDDEGFLYPSVNSDLCIRCGLCIDTCDFQKSHNKQEKPAVYAVKAKDSIRKNSTSGGMFVLLSDEILKNGGVVYGASFTEDMKTVHTRAQTVEQRDAQRASKYVQSDMGAVCNNIKKDLENGLYVLFSGTSCQVAGVKSFLSKVNTDRLLLVDILCHGVPSPLAFSEYIKFVEKKRGKKVSNYFSRAKDKGYIFNERIEYSDGSREVKTMLGECWNHLFYSNIFLRPSCYNCKYVGYNRESDITIADFWGIEDISPNFYDTKGVSLAIINSNKGATAFDRVSDSAEVIGQTFEKATVKNHNLITPTACPQSRESVWAEVKQKGFDHIFKQYYNPVKAVKRFIKKLLKK